MSELIISTQNYHLVSQQFGGYKIHCCQGIPVRHNDGNLQKEEHYDIVEVKSRLEAEGVISDFWDNNIAKFIRKEVLCLKVSCAAIYTYHVRCPECGGDAHILDFVLVAKDIYPIACPSCPGTHPKDISTWKNVGACTFLDKSGEELPFQAKKSWFFDQLPFKNYKLFLLQENK